MKDSLIFFSRIISIHSDVFRAKKKIGGLLTRAMSFNMTLAAERKKKQREIFTEIF